MHFLLDVNMPRSAAATLINFGHLAIDARDAGLGAASDGEIAAKAQSDQLCLLTRDFDFSDIRNYPPSQFFGIVVFELPPEMVATDIVRVVEFFVSHDEIVDQMAGRLAIVSPSRIRVRPPIAK